MPGFKLRFPITEAQWWADRYDVTPYEEAVIATGVEIARNGLMTRDQLYGLCKWKSPRRAKRAKISTDAYVREITQFCLSAKDERTRIEPLTTLYGVGWPTASVILHLCHSEPYPILDVRALWTVSCEVPKQYGFDFWSEYTSFTRSLAKASHENMRTLDRALWQYSKDNPPK